MLDPPKRTVNAPWKHHCDASDGNVWEWVLANSLIVFYQKPLWGHHLNPQLKPNLPDQQRDFTAFGSTCQSESTDQKKCTINNQKVIPKYAISLWFRTRPFFSVQTLLLVYLTQSHGLNTVSVMVNPAFILLVLISPLNFRFNYPNLSFLIPKGP